MIRALALLVLLPARGTAQTFTPTSLSASATISDTSMTVASAANVQPGFLMLVDREAVLVYTVVGTTVTVQRAEGGLLTAHAAGAPVYAGPRGWFAQEDPLSLSCNFGAAQVPYININTGFAWTCNSLGRWQNLNALSIGTAAGSVLIANGLGAQGIWSAAPVFGTAGTTAGTLGLANGGAGGAVWTLASGATSAWTLTGKATAPAQGDLFTFSNASGQMATVADVGTGRVLVSGGVSTVPTYTTTPVVGVAATTLGTLGLASGTAGGGIVTLAPPSAAFTGYTVTWPTGAPAQGAVQYYADAAGTLAGLSDVAAGSYLRSGGVNLAPLYSTTTIPNTSATGDLWQGTATNVVSALSSVAAGSYLRSAGVTTANVWSILTLPNAATQGDLLTATATNAIGSITAVAVGSYLRANGAGAVPIYSTLTLPNTSTQGDLMVATAANTTGAITAVAVGQVLVSNGVTTVPAYSATPVLGVAASQPGTLGLAKGVGGGNIWTLASAATSAWTMTSAAVAPAQGDLLTFSNATGQMASVVDVAAGSYLRAGGVGLVPVYSTTTLPNTVATGDIFTATGTNVVGVTADVATGQVLTSGGVTTIPAYSGSPTLTTNLTVPTVIGGTAVGSSLNLQSTSGTGSGDFIRFLIGTNGATEVARFNATSLKTDGVAGPFSININSAAGQERDFTWTTAGVGRWILRVEGNTESGANLGSDIRLQSRADNGAFLFDAFYIQRSNGFFALQHAAPDALFSLLSTGVLDWVGLTKQSAPANGQWNLTNNGVTAGFGLDVTTDAVAKFRVRAQNAYATVDALAYNMGGNVMLSQSVPTITSGFGTNPGITGTSTAFRLTLGTPVGQTGVVAFNTTFTNIPVVKCGDETSIAGDPIKEAPTTTNVTLTFTLAVAADKISCIVVGF